MATCDALPANLRARLTALAWQIRRWQAVRGVTWLAFTLALAGGAALLADAFFDLGEKSRTVLLAVWVALGAFVGVVGLIVPLCRRLRPEVLAALIEEKYPELGERLTSTVELAGTTDTYHGAPAFIELLRVDTEARTQPLNFLSAIPGRVREYALILAGVLVLLGLPLFAWPERYPELARRFLLPWYTPPLYALHVTPGDAVMGQGRPLTVAVRVGPLKESTPLPPTCTLVLTDAAGQTSRRRMQADDADAFSLHLDAVPGSFRYQVEIDRDRSETYSVTAIEPVQLAESGTQVTLTPPAYAQSTMPTQTVQSVADLSILQYGLVGFDLKFTQPAVAAALVWKTADGKTEEVHPLELSPERTAGRLEMPVRADGAFRLILEAEHGIQTELDPWPLTVKKDQPPVFVRVAIEGPLQGKADRLPAVLPYDSIPIAVQLADDVGVGGLELEYRINESPARSEPITLDGLLTQQAAGRHVFRLAGKVQEGDTVRYRLRAADNRQVPQERLGPNVTYHPDDTWLALKVARQAEPLKQQEILAQRDDLNRRLEVLQKDLQRQVVEVSRLRKDSQAEPRFQPDQERRLQQLRRDNQTSRNALAELARDLAPTESMQALANQAQAIADNELLQGDKALDQARQNQEQPATRNPRLDEAGKQLTAAVARLEELRRRSDQQAQARLDQQKLEMAADRQEQLAERTAEQATRDPIKDPDSAKSAKLLEREQAELAAELQRLAEQSPALREALDAARAEQARQMAQQAQELAQAQRELAEAGQERRADQLADLARKQQELADKAARLAQETRQPAQAAKVPPLLPDDSQKAANALEKGDPVEALKRQEQAAADLDRLGRELDRATDLARDPREAARQLARLQEGLRQQMAEETRRKDPTPLAQRLEALEREQVALQKTAEQISVPPSTSADKDRLQAAERAAEAAEALHRQDPKHADARMTQARAALEKLAERLPSLQQRQQQALSELAQLRRQQDQIAAQADKLGERDDPAKQAELAQKQAAVAERLSKLDTPLEEARHERTQAALNRALADLMDGRRRDMPASQQQAKQQLERLEQALAGKQPAVEPDPMVHVAAKPSDQSPRQQAEELARQQRQLAEATQNAAQQPGDAGKKALDQMAQQQKQLNEKASQLSANQAQQAQEQARAVMNQAQQALAKPDAGQAGKKQEEAARALDNLARQLPDQPAAAKPTETAAPQGLPQKGQAEQARQLAQAQRDLRAETQRLANQMAQVKPAGENPVQELAQQQKQIARQAEELAQHVGQQQGKQTPAAQQAGQAAHSAEQASKQMQAGALQPAKQAGEETAANLQQLAKQLQQAPGGEGTNPLQMARQLAQQQEALNRRLEPLAGNRDAERAQQQARQQELQQQTGDLAQALARLAQQMGRTPPAQSTQQAATASQQAQAAMQQAQNQDRQGIPGQGLQAQMQAAQALERASQQAVQAAQQMSATRAGNPQANPMGDAQAGQAVQQAQGQMSQAQGQLAKSQAQAAQSSMQRAAQSLQQAAQQLARQSGPPAPQTDGLNGATGGGTPDVSMLPKDLQKYAGKSWGELPGEVRSRILQDTRARYGDDYARLIKLYFEQMAETKRNPR